MLGSTARTSKGKDSGSVVTKRPPQQVRQLVQPSPRSTTLAMQRAAGNQVVTELLQQVTSAERAMDGECEEHRKEPLTLQRSGANQAAQPSVPPVVDEVLHSPGQPLDAVTRAFMESRFGHNFSDVRVHTDTRAGESAHAVSALAYTVGKQIVFRHGCYQPGSIEGRRLLAHELAHTIQQGAAAANPRWDLIVGAQSDPLEAEAAQRATSITGESRSLAAEKPLGRSALKIQRQLLPGVQPLDFPTESTEIWPNEDLSPKNSKLAQLAQSFTSLRSRDAEARIAIFGFLAEGTVAATSLSPRLRETKNVLIILKVPADRISFEPSINSHKRAGNVVARLWGKSQTAPGLPSTTPSAQAETPRPRISYETVVISPDEGGPSRSMKLVGLARSFISRFHVSENVAIVITESKSKEPLAQTLAGEIKAILVSLRVPGNKVAIVPASAAPVTTGGSIEAKLVEGPLARPGAASEADAEPPQRKNIIEKLGEGTVVKPFGQAVKISISGVTRGISKRKDLKFEATAGFTGGLTLTTAVRKWNFEIEFSPTAGDWQITLSYPRESPPPDLNRLKAIFDRGGEAIEGISKSLADPSIARALGRRDVEILKKTFEPYVNPVKDLIKSAQGIAEAKPGASFGVIAGSGAGPGGPIPAPGAEPEGVHVRAVLTIVF